MKRNLNVFFVAIYLMLATKASFASDEEDSNERFTEVINAEKKEIVAQSLVALESFKKNPNHWAHFDAYVAQNPYNPESFFDKLKLFGLYYLAPNEFSPVRHFPEIKKELALNPNYQITADVLAKTDALQLTTDRADQRVLVAEDKTEFAKDLILKIVCRYNARSKFYLCDERMYLDKKDSKNFVIKNDDLPCINNFDYECKLLHAKAKKQYFTLPLASDISLEGVKHILKPSIKMQSSYGFARSIWLDNVFINNVITLRKLKKADNFRNDLRELSPKVYDQYVEFFKEKETEGLYKSIITKQIKDSISSAEIDNSLAYKATISNESSKYSPYRDYIAKQYKAKKSSVKIEDIKDDDKNYKPLFDRLVK